MPNKNFFCLTAFVVALAELGASFLQAASQDNPTNSYQATAEGGAHQLHLDGNLHVQHAVRIVMADNQEMAGHVVSLAASDLGTA